MSTAEFIFQAAIQKHHKDVVSDLLNATGINGAIISVAFANLSGVSFIKKRLTAIGNQADVFIGIRNEISSYQALKALFETGVNLHVVDTGSKGLIFHPKIYASWTTTFAQTVVGSANLTFSGLTNNIEASIKLDLDLSDANDLDILDSIRNGFRNFKTSFPDHVISIDNEDKLKDLLKEGRISDEARIIAPSGNKKPSKSAGDTLKTIGTFKIGRPKLSLATKPKPIVIHAATPTKAATTVSGYNVVWESNSLVERDLSIPKGANTHATGSMLWKKASYEDIDQRHYFRDEVFMELDWQPDPKPSKSHLERSEASFSLIIKGIDAGTYSLKLSHNTKTNTASYRQNNGMTNIHWGDAKTVIAKEELLSRIMKLYKSSDPVPKFIIEID